MALDATDLDALRDDLRDDLRLVALAHASLDEIGVPRLHDSGKRLTLFGRIEALRAGKLDPDAIRIPGRVDVVYPCPRCGLPSVREQGDVCPGCAASMEACPS